MPSGVHENVLQKLPSPLMPMYDFIFAREYVCLVFLIFSFYFIPVESKILLMRKSLLDLVTKTYKIQTILEVKFYFTIILT